MRMRINVPMLLGALCCCLCSGVFWIGLTVYWSRNRVAPRHQLLTCEDDSRWTTVARNTTAPLGRPVCIARCVEGIARPCDMIATNSKPGFCAVWDEEVGRGYRVMSGANGGLLQSTFTCSESATAFLEFQIGLNGRIAALESRERFAATQAPEHSNTRGVVMSTHNGMLILTVTAISRLRASGCSLPVELFFRPEELDRTHPIVAEILDMGNVTLRQIEDPEVKGFYTKIYAFAHTSFDHALLLDTDNLVAADPEYLFATDEYQQHGAVFWPDHWHPAYSPLFNFDSTSLAWELFNVPYQFMFEGESGQVLIDRHACRRAIDVMLFVIKHVDIIENLKLLHGDKDIFRFAFFAAGKSFEMTRYPPGLAGFFFMNFAFCGQTIVQHDMSGAPLFYHRNTRKIGACRGWGNFRTWEYVQEYDGADLSKYVTVDFPWGFPCGTCWTIRAPTRYMDVRQTDGKFEAAALQQADVATRNYDFKFFRHASHAPTVSLPPGNEL